ncbi:MAG: efflux RND transporter permease subunit, partial [Proteobacteria bacterium]|nr:efflux RND transporter permease subunit [Pseudomonadota bacterium]
KSSASLYMTFALALLVVFLALAAQFESFVHPFIILLSVPLAVTGALASMLVTGLTINIYSQIGIIMLIGLTAKNAILIVEFAKQGEEEGMNRFDAAVHAARSRLRPILMTSFAFIFGVIPLAIASGPGQEMRQSLGTAVAFGMVGVTIFGLIFTPIFYVLLRKLGGGKVAHHGSTPAAPETPAAATGEAQ